MRKIFLLVSAAALLSISAPVQAQPYSGSGMMGGYGSGYGPGFMMGLGYGGGSMMGPGYGVGYGPGMMYGYGPDGRSYQGGPAGGGQPYRGKKLCWHETNADRNTGYYEHCGN